ncbi:MAG: hypothetical protein P1U87_21265 [Verrucomicrobiales bacterium]|nr:hypothetical protein [Verrucomicrobiales bacterium]
MKAHRNNFLLCLFFGALLSGCGRTSDNRLSDGKLSQWVGDTVRVQFRRDALGAAAPLPIPPMTGEINGAQTTVIGTLRQVESSAIVVEAEGRLHWIPREVILLVQAKP